MQKWFQDELSKTLDVMETTKVLEKTEPSPVVSAYSGACHEDSHVCDFLETHFLDKEVEFIKNMGDHLTQLHRLAVPSGQVSLRPTLEHDWSC